MKTDEPCALENSTLNSKRLCEGEFVNSFSISLMFYEPHESLQYLSVLHTLPLQPHVTNQSCRLYHDSLLSSLPSSLRSSTHTLVYPSISSLSAECHSSAPSGNDYSSLLLTFSSWQLSSGVECQLLKFLQSNSLTQFLSMLSCTVLQ